jgi:hypothetical protein
MSARSFTLHVWTLPGNEKTDTTVEVFATDGSTPLAPLKDDGFHEEVLTQTIPQAGPVYVKIAASSYYEDTAKNYRLYLGVE